MNFIDGVILIEKVTKWSTLANILIGVVFIIRIIMMFGGCRLVTTSHYYAHVDAVKGTGLALTCIGLALMAALSISINNGKQFNQLLDSIGWDLLEDTGKYRVTVTNDVDMNEFTSKYEIVDYDDGAYVIKIK